MVYFSAEYILQKINICGEIMFRDITRKKQKITENECIEILISEKRGVLSVIGDGGYPYGMPMNHYYNEEDGKIYFHCGKTGHRTDALRKCPKVSFCVTDSGVKKENGWALDFTSVIVFGKAEFITDKEKIADISRRISLKFTSDETYIENEIRSYLDNTDMFCIEAEHITGKRVNEA